MNNVMERNIATEDEKINAAYSRLSIKAKKVFASHRCTGATRMNDTFSWSFGKAECSRGKGELRLQSTNGKEKLFIANDSPHRQWVEKIDF